MPSKPDRPFLATITTAQQIAQHPLNNSSNKQLYTFSKASRFSKKNNNQNCNVAFYDFNEKLIRDNRAFSMGATKRFDFAKSNKNSPGPCVYFPKNKCISVEKKGYGFGKPHKPPKTRGQNFQPTPGPGTYDMKKSIPKGLQMGFRVKTKVLKDENVNVGPGLYKITNTLDPSGKGMLSQYKSSPGFRMVPSGMNKGRIKKVDNTPHYYDDKCQMNKEGKYAVSRFRNSQAKTFGKSKRQFFNSKVNNPGPGYYVMPSDFGVYRSSKAGKGE